MIRARDLTAAVAIVRLRQAQRQAAEAALGEARVAMASLESELAERRMMEADAEAAWRATMSAVPFDLSLARLRSQAVLGWAADVEETQVRIAAAERRADALAMQLRQADVRHEGAKAQAGLIERRLRRKREEARLADVEDRLLQRRARP